MPRAYFGRWLYLKILTLVSPYGMNPLLPQPFFDRTYEVRHLIPSSSEYPFLTHPGTQQCVGIFVSLRRNFDYKLSLNLRKHCLLSEQLSEAMKQNSDYTLQSNEKHLHVLRVKRRIRGFVQRPFWPRSGVGSYHSARAIRHYESRVCRDLKKQVQVSNFVVNLLCLICVMCS